jgi:hypothetical protein
MPRVEGPGYLLSLQLRGQSALSNDAGSGVGPGENPTGLNGIAHLIKEAAFEPKKHRARKLEVQAIPTQSKQNRRRLPRSLPKARATRARSGSRMFLCQANYRAHAPRTVQPSAPKRHRAIEFCCPPGPPHLVCTKFVNTISMPRASLSYVKKVILVSEQFDERFPSRKSCAFNGTRRTTARPPLSCEGLSGKCLGCGLA